MSGASGSAGCLLSLGFAPPLLSFMELQACLAGMQTLRLTGWLVQTQLVLVVALLCMYLVEIIVT